MQSIGVLCSYVSLKIPRWTDFHGWRHDLVGVAEDVGPGSWGDCNVSLRWKRVAADTVSDGQAAVAAADHGGYPCDTHVLCLLRLGLSER